MFKRIKVYLRFEDGRTPLLQSGNFRDFNVSEKSDRTWIEIEIEVESLWGSFSFHLKLARIEE